MSTAANRTLDDMLGRVACLVPGLAGVIAASMDEAGSGNTQVPVHLRPAPCAADGVQRNRAALDALLAYWVAAHPEAGHPYWAARCWSILIWQPLYLSVIGVHASCTSLSLGRIAQPVSNGWTQQVRIADHVPASGDTAALVEHAAREIRACCAQLSDELAPVIRVNPVVVRGTQADVVLAALLAARHAQPEWCDADVQALGERWLDALGLEGHGGLFPFARPDGTCALALDRRTCCYHYRRRDGELCSTCPRQSRRERIARLNSQPCAAAAT